MFGTMEGTVLDIDTNKGIENVYVTLSPSNKNLMTDSDGKFTFSELDAKQYSVTVQKNDYETNIKTLNVISSETTKVIITMKKKN
jgi:translation initiation factor 2 alpha subunit (eIF-2alpha)